MSQAALGPELLVAGAAMEGVLLIAQSLEHSYNILAHKWWHKWAQYSQGEQATTELKV